MAITDQEARELENETLLMRYENTIERACTAAVTGTRPSAETSANMATLLTELRRRLNAGLNAMREAERVEGIPQ